MSVVMLNKVLKTEECHKHANIILSCSYRCSILTVALLDEMRAHFLGQKRVRVCDISSSPTALKSTVRALSCDISHIHTPISRENVA